MKSQGLRANSAPFPVQPRPRTITVIVKFVFKVITTMLFIYILSVLFDTITNIQEEKPIFDPIAATNSFEEVHVIVPEINCPPAPKEVNCTSYCQDELKKYITEFRSSLRQRDLLEIKKYRNRANIYEAKIDCVYPRTSTNLYDVLSQYISPNNEVSSIDILIQDQPKEKDLKWRFNPHLTVIHIEFNKRILPEAFVFEYPTASRDIFRKQGLKVRIMGINYGFDQPAPSFDLQAGMQTEQVVIDDFYIDKADINSVYYEDAGRTTFGRFCNQSNCFQLFKAIRFEIYSESGSLEKFYLSRIKVIEAL